MIPKIFNKNPAFLLTKIKWEVSWEDMQDIQMRHVLIHAMDKNVEKYPNKKVMDE